MKTCWKTAPRSSGCRNNLEASDTVDTPPLCPHVSPPNAPCCHFSYVTAISSKPRAQCHCLHILPSMKTVKRFLSYKYRLTLSDTHFCLDVLQMFVFHAAAERMSLIHSSIQSVYGEVKDPAGGRGHSCDDVHCQPAALIIKTLWHSLHMQHVYQEY